MKYAIVTGGTKGIGKQIVCDLLKRGYFVFTNYAHDEIAAQTSFLEFQKISPNIKIEKADQADLKVFSQFIETIKRNTGSLDCLVLNTGITLKKDLKDISNAEWEKVMQVNVNSHFYLIRDLAPMISENGRIIFIGSLLGDLPHATSLIYGVTKSAIHAMAKNLVKYFAGKKITVNTIAPGFVETDWQKDKPIEIRNNILRNTAIKRFATVEEVSNTCLFLIDNEYINGSVIEVNGGYSYK
ncbi:MAG: SDR family oxidoreductase [Candidatus Symbiothrix sp.]|jgi:3-oxoacyl-[acyl-carrier protein] reductase|nr:SDR family oxidoreductase [Candidatus Symbiothrix sp.]